MTPFATETGPGIALAADNIDTDQLIPARFMKRSRADGYGDQLLYDMRFDADGKEKPDFPLNQIRTAPKVLIAGANFGCGSSREAAVYALVDHGIRCVIARSFADIFRSNAQRNGLLTVICSETDHNTLSTHIKTKPGCLITIDLDAQSIRAEGLDAIDFDIDPGVKRRLLLGLDELAETLEHVAAIEDFEGNYFNARPWARPHLPFQGGRKDEPIE